MSKLVEQADTSPTIVTATVTQNVSICREHLRLSITDCVFSGALPGQFLHLGPAFPDAEASGTSSSPVPLLRRAFSIAGERLLADGRSEYDVIYRVVGTATEWMAGLSAGDPISVIGPLGRPFPIVDHKKNAWLVGGGVGLPPLLWLAEALDKIGKSTTAIIGARSADLIALSIGDPASVRSDGGSAALVADEFTAVNTPVVIATDDGSLGVHGHVGVALESFHGASVAGGVDDMGDAVVYTCGPEVMMESVARFCLERGIECFVCLERSMACGTGTCQSCAVSIRDTSADDDWRFALCCTDGPVFPADSVIW